VTVDNKNNSLGHSSEVIQGIGPAARHGEEAMEKKRLKTAIILTAVVMVLEFVGGFLTNSLALMSDAGHMLTHFFALGMSYFAISLSSRPATKTRTYGLFRTEVLVAFINSVVLFLITAWIFYEAVVRFIAPKEIMTLHMLIVAVIGLIANGISIVLLHGVCKHDINIRSAFVHVLGDLFSSVAVVIGGIVIYYTGMYRVDSVLSILISVLILIWASRLFWESVHILLESTPKDVDIDEVVKLIKEKIPEVREVHDVHIWVITSQIYAMTAHILVDDMALSQSLEILDKINQLVDEHHHIRHTNIQFEC